MTRINLIPPTELCRQHLVAEYREAPRIFGLVREATQRGETYATWQARAPKEYTLGKGHCLFFYGRLGFLAERQYSLIREMQARGYSVNHPLPPVDGIDPCWFRPYTPTPEAIAINVARINERLLGMGLLSKAA